ncbi:MAG TPA: hypothetical protein VFZ21_21535, partial [Gemmatimonadaceae bacterium]|nr:hypothetical protein [Gemmatimonadaceae bacterium]
MISRTGVNGRFGRLSASLIALAAVAGSARAQKPSDPGQRVDRRFAVASDASIRLMGGFSRLRVIGWDRDSLVITGTMARGTRLEGNAMSNALGAPRGAKFF